MDQRKKRASKIPPAAINLTGLFTHSSYHFYNSCLLFWLLLPLIFVAVRSVNLLALPLYLDEGIYIGWSRLFSQDSGFAYASLTDGKSPLFIWLTAGLHNFLPDFLLAGRYLSVIAGTVTLLSWMVILRLESGKKAAFLFWLLFLITPYGFLIERMAFADSLMTALISFAAMLLILSLKKTVPVKDWWLASAGGLLAGFGLGMAYLTKTSARAYLVILLLLGLNWIIKALRQKKYLSIPGILISTGLMYLVYREILSDFRIGAQRTWGMIGEKEATLTYSLPQILNNLVHHPNFYTYQGSVPFILSYFGVYLGLLIIPFLVGTVHVFKSRKSLIWIFIYFLAAAAGTFLSARMMSSRYFYPLVPPFLVLAALGSFELWEKIKNGKLILGFILTAVALQSAVYLINPLKAIYSYDDQRFFVSGDISAPGIAVIKNQLKDSPEQNILGVSGIWGIADGVTAELSDAEIEVVGLEHWLGEDSLNLGKLVDNPKPHKYLYLTLDEKNALQILGRFYDYSIIYQFTRPGSGSKVYLIRLGPPKQEFVRKDGNS